ncbi:MAG: hypothetical protein EOO38_06315 [Cytophagaceae bacterium]|nr:MAG: hypothetical protein EOO38_06315 [Cytophagaceae bacterium]
MNQSTWTQIFCKVIFEIKTVYEPTQVQEVADDLYRSVGRFIDPTIAANVIRHRSTGQNVSTTMQLAADVEQPV